MSDLTKKEKKLQPAEDIKATVEIKLAPITQAIEKSKDLKADRKVFTELAQVALARKEVEDILDQIEAVEREVKLAVNARAKALYGEDWTAVQGPGFKFSRSFGGSIYDIPEPAKVDTKFLKVTVRPNTDKINEFRETKNALPDGIELNPNRNESIKITVKP